MGHLRNHGANIQLWTKESVPQQQFKVTYLDNGYYSIIAIHSGQSLDVDKAGYYSGTNIAQSNYTGYSAQQWIIKEAGDGYYYVISKCNGLYIDVYQAETSNGANVQICDFNGNNAQKFKFVKSQITGIDVSKYQNTIDWAKVKNNVDYAMIRVGYRGYGTGKIVSDSNYSTNIKNALANGIRCGVYFFSQAINEAEGIEEAKWVINSVKGYKITYPIAIDTEWSSEEKNGRADNISKENRTQAIKGFCETIKNAGYIPMIYANRDWLLENLNMSELSQYDVWLAHYVKGAPQNKSNYTGKYTMWQYTSQGEISGILGNVDMSICYKNY